MSYIEGRIGQLVNGADGALVPVRMGKLGDVIKSDLHGKYYEQNYRGNLFCFGKTDTVLSAVNAIATVGATARPIIGVYNPSGSGKNLVILKAAVIVSTVVNTATLLAGFHWQYSIGNSAISTGSTPISCSTLSAAGSIAKAFAVSVALTGITNNLAYLRAASIQPVVNAAGAATAVSLGQGQLEEDVAGSIIVPPGGVVAIQCGTDPSANPVNVSTSMLWEEVPV